MTKVFEYIKKIADLCQYPITISGERPNVLERWIVTSGSTRLRKIDNGPIEPVLRTDGRMILEHEMSFSSAERLESNWRYYTSHKGGMNNVKPLFGKSDKYIYCLNNIFCLNETEALFYVRSSSPLNIWINGQLVLMSNYYYHIKPYLFTYKLQKGNNIFIVEEIISEETRMLADDEFDFLVTLKPWRFLLDKRNNHIFTNDTYLTQMKTSYNIVPDKAMFCENEELGITILPRYINGAVNDKLRVEFYNYRSKIVQSIEALAGERFVVTQTAEMLGPLQVKVISMFDSSSQSETYIFRGDFNQKRAELLDVLETKENIPFNVVEFIENISVLQQISDGTANGIKELMIDRQYYYIFRSFFEIMKFIETAKPRQEMYSLCEIPLSAITAFKRSSVDDIFYFYTVFLPKNYDSDKKYPLILYLAFSTIQAKIPELPEYLYKHDFEDCIVAGLYGRGGFNKDYINEAVIIESINEMIENYNIDRDQIHTIGICTGALRSFGISLRLPDVFATLMSIGGIVRMDINNPDYTQLENLNSMNIYQLCNIEDEFFNTSRLIKASNALKNNRIWYFDYYSHKESVEMFNTKELYKQILGKKREEFPRKIYFTTFEPIYNKSFWIKIDYMEDLCSSANVNAEIKSKDVIDIKTSNVAHMQIYLSPKHMDIKHNLQIDINGMKNTVLVEEPSILEVNISEEKINITICPLNISDFYKKYNRIGIEEKNLGIKQVYYKRCRIIKPENYRLDSRRFVKKLMMQLQQPLRERQRNYVYETYDENKASAELLKEANFVYLLDMEKSGWLHTHLLRSADIEVGENSLIYKGIVCQGNYFALIKCRNPFQADKFALLLIIKGEEELENELLNFVNTFDTNPLFYNEAVIYSEGKYHGYR